MRWARLAATLLAAAGLLYLILVYGLASAAADRGDARAALALRPHSAGALSLAADNALSRGDMAGAEGLARRALILMPRDVRALRVMGFASSARGNPRLGSELLVRAGALSWRDPVTQAWLVEAALDQRNFTTAAQRIDAILRSGQQAREMLTLAHQAARIPEMREALIVQLADDPPWRAAFFSEMNALPKEAWTDHALLIDALRAREGPLPRAEVVRFVRHMVEQGDYALARRVWLGTVIGEARGYAATVFDGDFRIDAGVETEQPRYPFEWELESGQGAMALIGTPRQLIGETALNVRAGDAEQRLASQTILLAAGRHRLTYDTIAGDGLSPQSFAWRIVCVGNNGERPLGAATGRKTGAWQSVVREFDVPGANCAAQRIEIVALSGASADAEAWFDHVSVQ